MYVYIYIYMYICIYMFIYIHVHILSGTGFFSLSLGSFDIYGVHMRLFSFFFSFLRIGSHSKMKGVNGYDYMFSVCIELF